MSVKNSSRANRQRKTKDPCEGCLLHRSRCICDLIPNLNLKTRLTLVIHSKELKRTTNTGRLATLALRNSQICVRGIEGQLLNFSKILHEDYDSFLLYPSEDAIELSTLPSQMKRPVQLIVPDGNWRQASKVNVRHRELDHIRRVKVSVQKRDVFGRQYLRKEHFKDGLSTLEAIAHAIGHFEGKEVKNHLLNLYQAKLKATLEGRQNSSAE